MLQEYALEPLLLSSWSDFRFFISQFGYDQGRLIARYPKKWKKKVYESLGGCPDIERSKIEEALRRIDHKMVPRHADSWIEGRDWLINAEEEHALQPFWAILAQNNPRSNASVLLGTEVDGTLDWETLAPNDSRRLWNASRSRIIRRIAEEMADAVDVFLRQADHILLVDKHFGP